VSAGLGERDLVEAGIENHSAHDGVVLDVPALPVEVEGRLLAQRAAQVPVEHDGVISRDLARKRIPGVEGGVVSTHKELAVKFVRARLGKNFDPAVA